MFSRISPLGWSLALAVVVGCASRPLRQAASTTKPPSYPETRRVDQVDNYHGVAIRDPYRWLEDDNSAETKAWVEAQNQVTRAYLDRLPARQDIKRRLTEIWNYERFTVPVKEGGRYFFSKNTGLQNQNVLYWTDSISTEPKVLIDPNTLSADGTVALAGSSVSPDGKLFAYGLSTSGSDWQEWKVREVATGRDLTDHLRWIKFSGAAWNKDSTGFYYSRYAEPKDGSALSGQNRNHQLYFHRLGTDQSLDHLVYERPDEKEWLIHGSVTDDGRFLLITVNQGSSSKNRVSYKDLALPESPVVDLFPEFDASYSFIDNDGSTFWFKTDLQAPRGRVIGVDIDHPRRDWWREVIPQTKFTLSGVGMVNDSFIVSYLRDAQSMVQVFDRQGKLTREVQLPQVGTAAGFSGRRSDRETFYSFTSFTTPSSIYRYDLTSGRSSLFRQPTVDFKASEYVTEQVFYPSRDGTNIPMFLTHKKGLTRHGQNPVLLYGYGGFNISMLPAFSSSIAVWLEMGGVYAHANLRGGGEYGEEWHQAGTKLRKQNVFDDFIGAAEWLIAKHYTSREHLAIFGRSNGGLLVGAAMTQRPDLFGAALPAVGVMDMLRFQKFTIGWAWVSDFGSSDNPEEFQALRAYSPLHNLKPGTHYPATLVTTADHDDRVVPAHSFKFAATLQQAQSGSQPVLIRIETKAGHGAGKPTAKLIDEVADQWAFLAQALGMADPMWYPKGLAAEMRR